MSMRSGKAAAAAILIGISLVGGGSMSVATVGSAIADARNTDQPRFNATARCRDGTWSWNKNPDDPGTCANHGGVSL